MKIETLFSCPVPFINPIGMVVLNRRAGHAGDLS